MNRDAARLTLTLLGLCVLGCTSQQDSGASPDAEAGKDEHHAMVAVDDTNFNVVVLQSDKPVLVDFWAEWCGPCQMLAPIVAEVATEFEGRAVVAKVDVDRAQYTAQQYGIASIPTLMLFKDGKMVDRIVGLSDKQTLTALLDSAL